MKTLHLKKKMPHRILSGHPWVFAGEVAHVQGKVTDGDTVACRSPHGQFLGKGIYNSRSQIIFRRYSRGKEELEEPLIRQRLATAFAYRENLTSTREKPNAQRLFWSESDGLPGLILDRFGDVVVLQTLTLAMANLEPLLVPLLVELLQPRTILSRNDALVRQQEGLPLEKKLLWGAPPSPLEIQWGELWWQVDPWEGQKTGLYLDQFENYAAVAKWAQGREVLDCFCHQGGFGLWALQAGARHCWGIDQSAPAIESARKTAKRNGLETAEFQQANVFDLLPQWSREKRQFDLIILDPPSFTKSKVQLPSALRGYKELHLRALQLLRPGGILATFCCSHHVGEMEWRHLASQVAGEMNVSLRLRERLTQAKDHPILAEVPETEYLRGYVLQKV